MNVVLAGFDPCLQHPKRNHGSTGSGNFRNSHHLFLINILKNLLKQIENLWKNLY